MVCDRVATLQARHDLRPDRRPQLAVESSGDATGQFGQIHPFLVGAQRHADKFGLVGEAAQIAGETRHVPLDVHEPLMTGEPPAAMCGHHCSVVQFDRVVQKVTVFLFADEQVARQPDVPQADVLR